MHAALGLLALALVGQQDLPVPRATAARPAAPVLANRVYRVESPPNPAAPMVTYQLWVVDLEGVDWRESVYAQLQPVVHRGSSTVWTAHRSAAGELLKRPGTKVVQAPKVTAHSEAPAHISHHSPHRFVGDQTRHADGPVNQASYVAYSPKVEDVREGFAATISGRKLDQGVLLKFVIEDTHLTALHTVLLSEKRPAGDGSKDTSAVRATVQVPEIARGDVAGEWLVPNDGMLLVSLGAYTVADRNGKAVVHERLVLLEAGAVDATAVDAPRRSVWTKPAANAVEPAANPMPTLPSRSLPQAHDESGPIPLPPLPQDPEVPTTIPGTSDPAASPQTKPAPTPDAKPATPTPARETRVTPPAASFDLPVFSDATIKLSKEGLNQRLTNPIHLKRLADGTLVAPIGPAFGIDGKTDMEILASLPRVFACGIEDIDIVDPENSHTVKASPAKKDSAVKTAKTPEATTVKAKVLRIPLSGSTIEIRITPGTCPGDSCDGCDHCTSSDECDDCPASK